MLRIYFGAWYILQVLHDCGGRHRALPGGALLESRFHLALLSSDSDFPIRRKSDLEDLHEHLDLDNGILDVLFCCVVFLN